MQKLFTKDNRRDEINHTEKKKIKTQNSSIKKKKKCSFNKI